MKCKQRSLYIIESIPVISIRIIVLLLFFVSNDYWSNSILLIAIFISFRRILFLYRRMNVNSVQYIDRNCGAAISRGRGGGVHVPVFVYDSIV